MMLHSSRRLWPFKVCVRQKGGRRGNNIALLDLFHGGKNLTKSKLLTASSSAIATVEDDMTSILNDTQLISAKDLVFDVVNVKTTLKA